MPVRCDVAVRALWTRMRRYVCALLAPAWLIAGCSSNDSSEPSRPAGAYRLVTVGGRTAASYALEGSACEYPAFSEYRFSGDRWHSVDTIPLTPACVPYADTGTWQPVRRDSGVFRIAADTLALYVLDQQGSPQGPVSVGRWSDDSIVFSSSDVEPPDWIYVRAP
jgi:hypothetical protein